MLKKSKLKFEHMKCPFCKDITSPYNLQDYSDKYIKCSNESCEVVYIPRDKNIRKKLCEIITKNNMKKIHCLEKSIYKSEDCNCERCSEGYSTECINCSRYYIIDCVFHNNQFSICPGCSFKNPYSTESLNDISRYLHGHGFSTCAICKKHFKSCSRSSVGDESSSDEDACYYDYCGNCLYGDTFSEKFCEATAPFKLPNIDSYPKISLNSELHELSLLYLPTC